jgi:hypothetical protein
MTDKKAVLLGLGRRVKMDVHPNTGKCNIESFWGGGWLVAVEEESCEAIRDWWTLKELHQPYTDGMINTFSTTIDRLGKENQVAAKARAALVLYVRLHL